MSSKGEITCNCQLGNECEGNFSHPSMVCCSYSNDPQTKVIWDMKKQIEVLKEQKKAYEDTIEKIAEGFGQEDCLNYGITLIDAIADLLKDCRAYKWCNEKLKKQKKELTEENEELKLSVKVLESQIQGEEEDK